MRAASALWVLAGVAAVAALPNGMLPPDEAHPAHAHLMRQLRGKHVDGGAGAVSACAARMAALRRLVASGDLGGAQGLSRSLDAASRLVLPEG